jgi:hypothetical protein
MEKSSLLSFRFFGSLSFMFSSLIIVLFTILALLDLLPRMLNNTVLILIVPLGILTGMLNAFRKDTKKILLALATIAVVSAYAGSIYPSSDTLFRPLTLFSAIAAIIVAIRIILSRDSED